MTTQPNWQPVTDDTADLLTLLADERDAIYAAVMTRYPDLDGEALAAKVRRVAAISAHANDGIRWTA